MIKFNTILASIALVLISFVKTEAQTNETNIALNLQVKFVNESEHGMLIIHRLLELYNQELNKFVDLENYKLNNISNEDFPDDIFADPKHLFYKESPYQIFNAAMSAAQKLPQANSQEIKRSITAIKNILQSLEEKRKSIPNLIATNDMQKKEGLDVVYSALEDCKVLFDQFETERNIIQNIVNKTEANNVNEVQKAFFSWEKSVMEMMLHLRNEDVAKAIAKMAEVKKQNAIIRSKCEKQQIDNIFGKDIINNINKIDYEIDKFVQKTAPPDTYKLYGSSYYYFNNRLTGSLNRYGEGAIHKYNQWVNATNEKNKNQNLLLLTEAAHFFKVIYPDKKIVNTVQVPMLAAPVSIPTKFEERKIVKNNQNRITTNRELLEIEIYDHQENDRDTISLNYNGKWILRNSAIGNKPIKMKIPIADGDNYLILHAENLGIKPPNTAAIRYSDEEGERRTIILNSDFQQSEYILINRKK